MHPYRTHVPASQDRWGLGERLLVAALFAVLVAVASIADPETRALLKRPSLEAVTTLVGWGPPKAQRCLDL